MHGSANVERGKNILVLTTGGGHKSHVLCSDLGNLGVCANWESGLSTKGENSKSETY